MQLEEDIFIKMPQGYRKTRTILKLNKALYSLQKSLILWQRALSQSLRKLGFELVPHEPCCFIKNGIIMFFYIDNIVFVYKKHQKDTILGLIN